MIVTFCIILIEGESLFEIRTQKLDAEKNQSEAIKKLNANFAKAIVKPDTKDYPEVDEFLQSVNLEKYKEIFIANGFEDLDTILELKDEHFQVMQLPLGHKLKILKKIREIRKEKNMDVTEVKSETKGILKVATEEVSTVNLQLEEETKTGEAGNTASILNGEFDEEESHKEFLKAREAWLNERKKAQEPSKESVNVEISTEENKMPATGFFAELGDGAWNMPALPEYAENGTGMSPRNDKSKKEQKDCCFGCFKFFTKGSGFEYQSIHKTFCDESCFNDYFNKYAVNCRKCNKKLLCENALFENRMYFCSEECVKSETIIKEDKINLNDEEINKQTDDMLKLEEL